MSDSLHTSPYSHQPSLSKDSGPGDWLTQLPPGRQRRYPRRTIMTSPGNDDDEFFLLLEGSARICLLSEEREQTLGYMKPGSIYVSHTPAWVESIEPCTIQCWPLAQIRSLFITQPALALGAFREVGMMLQTAINVIEDLAFRPVESRLARYLLSEAESQQGNCIQLVGTTESLASLLGTTRQTLSTILSRFAKQGLIERRGRQQVVLLQPDLLQEVSAS